jgi:hypothetical protein
MTVKLSTGLRNKMMASDALAVALNLGFVDIYSGPVPATADAVLDGSCVKLCRISNNSTGTGLTLDAAGVAAGVIQKTGTEIWAGSNLASGVATFYRHVTPADDATLSTTQSRIQGEIATSGSDMNLTSTTLTSGAPQTLNFYSVALPTL